MAEDPVLGNTFSLEVDGVLFGFFSNAAGFESSVEVVEHKVVDDKGREGIHKIPGRQKWANITLGRGVTSSMDLWKWHELVLKGDIKGARRNGSVIMYSRDLNEVARYNFTDAWPVRWKGGDVGADDNNAAVEEIEIAHHGLKRVK